MKLQIKKNGVVVKEINLSIPLDILMISLCVIGIIIDFQNAGGTLAGYCIMFIILTLVTWHPKYRWYFKK